MRHITTNDTPAPALRGIADHSWHARGLCHGMDPSDADKLFFHAPRNHEAIAEAKSICGWCPVKKDCLNYALDNEIRQGMWGGLTEIERRPWHAEVSKRLDYSRVRAAPWAATSISAMPNARPSPATPTSVDGAPRVGRSA